MKRYDNEFFRGPPDNGPTLDVDRQPTGAEFYTVNPEKTTDTEDTAVTQEEQPGDPRKKKSKTRRITKAIKLLASCMAAVVITEAATNMAATIEPPAPEAVPAGLYYAGQWPGVEPVHNGVYYTDMEADMGDSIQIPLGGKAWRLSAGSDWRMCWFEGNGYSAYIDMRNRETGVYLVAELSLIPHNMESGENSYTKLTTPTGEDLYVRAFFLDFGKYAEEYGLDREGMESSAEIRQALVDEFFAGIRVSAGTEDGWQGLQIGDRLYSQQGPEWYGVGGFGDLEIHIPWVHYAADHNLQNMTPYSRVKVNGITWSIYFTDDDTYLWAVPNIEPELCLGGLTARFMCADAVRRGEYISDEEWLEMGGFTSVSQRQTAVDIMVECLQHHYALRERRYPRDWPWKGPTEQASYWVWSESLKGTWTQFSFGDAAYRVDSTDPELRFHWERTVPLRDDVQVDLEISRMVQNEEVWAIGLDICRTEFAYKHEDFVYLTTQATGGETLYLQFRAFYRGGEPEFTPTELRSVAEQILGSVTFRSNADNSGWSTMLLCDTMHSPNTMEWSGSGIVGSLVEIQYIHFVEIEALQGEVPRDIRIFNGIAWSFHYDAEERIIWAVPDIEPDVCIGFDALNAMNYYREKQPDDPDCVWDEGYELSAEDVDHAVEAVSEALSHIYPLGMEPEEPWDDILDWPHIGYIMAGNEHTYSLQDFSKLGTYAQFSLGNRSYRLNSSNAQLRFFWNKTTEVNGVMQADLYISHMGRQRDWQMELFVQNEPFTEPRNEREEIDAVIPAPEGSELYLRFRRDWYGKHGATDTYEVFSGWVQTVMDAITAAPADPNGWGQVYICDLMTTPISQNWDGNAKVTEEYEITHYSWVTEQNLQDLDPYATLEFNGIVWTIVYEEADDMIWGIPDCEARVCIGASAKNMVGWFLGEMPESDYLDAAVEGLAEGLSKYYIRRDFEMKPVEEVIWPAVKPADNGSNFVTSLDSNQNTYGLFSLDGAVYQIDSYREDLRFWWDGDNSQTARVLVYSMGENGTNWIVTMEVQRQAFETFEGDASCYRTVALPGGEFLYLRMESWNLDDTPVEDLAEEILGLTAFDYCGKEERWHTVYIGNTLQTQQSYDWTGMEMVYQNYAFRYIHDAQTYDVHQQDYEGQRTINGIVWTFRFHKDNDVLYAYPNSEPNMCIGANPDMLYRWYEGQYGPQQDYFEAIVESMSAGLQNYYLRPGVEIEPVVETGPVFYTADTNSFVQISLGSRGYCLQSDLENAWMTWYFTTDQGGVLAADLSMGADCGATVYISEAPLVMYDNRSHGQIQVEGGGTLYWYCIELYDGTDAQLADLMNSMTATGALDYRWGGAVIEDTIYSRQSMEWSGWETVEVDGGRSVMMWNLERPANLDLGNPVARKKINRINWTLYITEDYSSEHRTFIWAVPDVDPNLAIGSDYENAVYRYYEVNGLADGFNGDLWSAESKNGAAEMIFQVLSNYYPR